MWQKDGMWIFFSEFCDLVKLWLMQTGADSSCKGWTTTRLPKEKFQIYTGPMAKHVLEKLELKDKLSSLLEDKPKTPPKRKKNQTESVTFRAFKKNPFLSTILLLTLVSRAEYSYDLIPPFAAARGGEGWGGFMAGRRDAQQAPDAAIGRTLHVAQI